ncbi:MAG: hypothetical protein RMK01_01650 [Thermomicrobium sp.]|nr:hypothetical protein [Thermomicrobium sp.]MDW8058760.1 hypothetical protein [Thermomicrobium sp.]
MAGAERGRDGRLRLRTAALLGALFGLLACSVLFLSLVLLGPVFQLAR